ncbi:MAG: DUF192 domain-containing protein [Planctomycetes bacterium]|nr:DUF192 domain-containing protein [Planctomycetota bacterium]
MRERDGAVVADEVELAASFLRRLRGLMGRRALPPGRGLWLEPCASIHMMFVPFSIDVLFVTRRGDRPLGPGARAEVLEVAPRVRPWVGLAWCAGAFGAVGAIEVAAGRAGDLGVAPGDLLTLEAA